MVADRLAEELGLPVFLYGLLGGGRTRAELRRGGPGALAERMRAGELTPDFGPRAPHPTAGAVLVAARPPLVAFNLELAPPATLDDARRIAALVREGGAEGLPGVRAIGLELAHRDGVAQVSTNVEDHRAVPLAALLEAVARHAPVAARRARGPRAARRASTAGRPTSRSRAARRSRTPSRLDPTMAQTKKKRSTKHRGNAAGVVEARGRTGRKLTEDEKRKNAAAGGKPR